MGILVTPKSQAEVNQLVSVLHSAGYKHFSIGDRGEVNAFQVGVAAVVWPTSNDYCYKASDAVIEIEDAIVEVNELYTLLRG